MKTPTLLLILDGLGFRKEKKYNAVAQANTPTLDYLKKHFPHTLLEASGPAVGLLPEMMGNSEVGHLTIGSGRIINQPIVQLHDLIDSQQLIKHTLIQNSFTALAHTGKTLHLIGLLSDAVVHSHIKHLFAFIDYAHHYGIKHIAIHSFLDGRDTPPKSAQNFLQQLEAHIKNIPEAYIASICGRFYAMDRNKEWSRTQQTYDMLTIPEPIKFNSWEQALTYYYDQKITDEFIPPTQLNREGIVRNEDGLLFFNYRPDRARQLTAAFIQPRFTDFKRTKLKLTFFITPTVYDAKLPTQSLLNKKEINNTLMEVLCQNNLFTFSIAETEKYAHVTYFFNAGREKLFPQEQHVIIPSISADTYKNIPKMQADKITQAVLHSLQTDPQDFYLINYANPDMVGHSGDFEATKKAVEYVDKQIKKLYQTVVEEMNGTLYVTADHGNAETMWDEKNNQPCTAHTANPVEFIFANRKVQDKKIDLPLKGLSDIAPFILHNLKITTPKEMS